MRDPFSRDVEFRKLILGDPSADLARANLELARDAYPELDPQPYLDRIDALAARVDDRCAANARPRHVLGQINWVLFVEEGFRGNVQDYHDPGNSYLNEVLDRKLGIPISLAVLYAAVAERVGLALDGVNLPGHFLLRVRDEGPPTFVDAFHEGRVLDLEGCEQFFGDLAGRPVRFDDRQVAPCDAPTTASRMLRNLRAIYLDRGDFASALPVARRLAALNPDDPSALLDWGMTGIRADRPGEAIAPLERYVAERSDAPDADEIRGLIKVARREVASRN